MSFLSFRKLARSLGQTTDITDFTEPWLALPPQSAAVSEHRGVSDEPVPARSLIERVLDEGGRRHFAPMQEAVVLDRHHSGLPSRGAR
jgi:hypothetical protein